MTCEPIGKDGLFIRRGKRGGSDEEPDRGGERVIRALRRAGFKITRQRLLLARTFSALDHMTVDDLHREAARYDPTVGRVTAYRFLRALCEAGVARERHFEDGLCRFDNIAAKEHHDHLICEACGKIVEFTCDRIETLQDEISRSRGFEIHGHRLEIRGLCRDCRGGIGGAA